MATSFYVPEGDRFVPTGFTRGPWDPGAQHAGPPAALLGRTIERCQPRDDAMFARITFEILRPIKLVPLAAEARLTRPGRNVQMLEGSLSDEDGVVMRATAWRIRLADVPAAREVVKSAVLPTPAGPEAGADGPFFPIEAGIAYHEAVDYRFLSGGFLEAGPATVWMRVRLPLLDGEVPSPLQRVLIVADSGNGVSSVIDWRTHLFINTDLTVHLHRLPEGEWVCLDARTVPQPHGVGMADSVLFDEQGEIGRAVQSLLVAER